MCGRYVTPEEAEYERFWHIGRANWRLPLQSLARRYNVAPQQGEPRNYIPIIRLDRQGERELVAAQWWLLPAWSREPRVKYSTFNARIETVATAASFRDSFRTRRCIIPAAGWYEWQHLPSGKQPWYFHSADGKPLSFAAIWDRWRRGDTVIDSCSLIVGDPDPALAYVHDRLPLTLRHDDEAQWLSTAVTDPECAMALLKQAPVEAVAFHRVSTRVNNSRNEGSELITPLGDESAFVLSGG